MVSSSRMRNACSHLVLRVFSLSASAVLRVSACLRRAEIAKLRDESKKRLRYLVRAARVRAPSLAAPAEATPKGVGRPSQQRKNSSRGVDGPEKGCKICGSLGRNVLG